jgi:hypothetical protein
MLDDIPNDPLASPENCTLDEIISGLQNHACDPSVDSNQAGFGSFMANHVIKEKLYRYHKESMVPPKLGYVWGPRIYVTIGKITWPAVLDLRFTVSVITRSLCDHLDLPPIKKCDIDLKPADCSITNAHGRVNNVLLELHMTFVPANFIIMDMEGKSHSPIILGRPFLRATCAIIDAKEGSVKLKFPHKKFMEHFLRKKEGPKNCPHGMRTS